MVTVIKNIKFKQIQGRAADTENNGMPRSKKDDDAGCCCMQRSWDKLNCNMREIKTISDTQLQLEIYLQIVNIKI